MEKVAPMENNDIVIDAFWLKMRYDSMCVWKDQTSELWKHYMEQETSDSTIPDTLREHLARSIGYSIQAKGVEHLSNLKKRREFVDAVAGSKEKTHALLKMLDNVTRDHLLVQLNDMALVMQVYEHYSPDASKQALSYGRNYMLRHILCPRFESRGRVQESIRHLEWYDKAIKPLGVSLEPLKKYI